MAEEKTLYVGPNLVDCVGVGPMKCMQVKEDPAGEYLLFYSNIEGFSFEAGYEYELKVSVEKIPNPPADGSSLRYKLIEVVSKTATASIEETTTMENFELNGTSWTLSSVNIDGTMVAPIAGSQPTLEFKDGQLGGRGSCNNFFGGFTVEGERLTVGKLGSTLMACPEELMRQERAYMQALQAAATHRVAGNELHILNAAGETVLTFTAAQPAALTGVTWVAGMVNNGRQAVTSLVNDTTITIRFNDEGRVSGSAGCNRYMTTYTVDGETISIQPAATTRMMCPGEGVMEQERAYLNALQEAATYGIRNGKLELRTAEGSLIASYTVGEEQ